MIKVTYFSRKLGLGWSLERVFSDIAENMPDDIDITHRYNRFHSQGFLSRLYDVISSPFSQGDVNHITGSIHYVAYLLSRKKTILTIHDCYMIQCERGIKRWLLWFFWLWLPVKCCAYVVAISNATKNDISSLIAISPHKLKVIYDPVSRDFTPFPKEFNTRCPRILHIGSTLNKNLDRHISALTGLSCELVIIGCVSHVQYETLEKSGLQFDVLKNISNAEIIDQYNRCDLLLFASTFEGFGLPILEAQAIGRPVVTSQILSMPEVAGGAACLVDPFDISSIRAGVKQIIDDSKYRNDLIGRGLENVKRFDVKYIASQYADLYREVASV